MATQQSGQRPHGGPQKSSADHKAWFALILSAGALVAAFVAVSDHEANESKEASPSRMADSEHADDSTKDRTIPDGFVEVGGVQRPQTDLKPDFGPGKGKLGKRASELEHFDYGRSPEVKLDANVHTRSIEQAIAERKYPERLSPMVAPRPFRRESYDADPAAYLNVVEPGRVFQPAQPGPDVPRIRRLMGSLVRIKQGESAPLRVRATPGAPVTFTSFDSGQFENQLSSITVAADADGVAVAKYTGTPGVINTVNILAASPVTSGRARFTIRVALPKPAAAHQADSTESAVPVAVR